MSTRNFWSTWLSSFFSKIMATHFILSKRSGERPKSKRLASYHLVSLRSTCYKLLEHLILQHIFPAIEKLVSPDQAGFQKARSTCDQVASTNWVSARFIGSLDWVNYCYEIGGVHFGRDTSSWRFQWNGLPQGSVLAPILFNLYTNDLLVTCDPNFIYADDICLATQSQFFSELDCRLSSDLTRMLHYCRQWRLKPRQLQVCFTYTTPSPAMICLCL